MKQITNPDNNMWRSADPPQRTERVAARIGGGGLKVIDQEHGLSDKSGSVFKQSLRQINDRILENNDIECIANGLSSNDKLTIDMNEVPERLQAELITDYDEFRQMIADAQSIHHNEPDVYFYHSDHLGSASWITDNGGLAVQHLQYLPYGERYVDQRISGYSERFTFTGKERDEETGYGYFGARYMDHELMTMWLSVDPMADKYPSISPYAYCAWNPVKIVDPDGMELTDFKDANGNLIKHIEDGSDAVFVLQNALWDADKNKMVNENGIRVKPSNAFFKFSKGTSDNINIETVINFSQEFCKDNYTNDDKTYCNYAAGFVIKSFVSACKSKDMKVDGDMSMFFYDNGRVKPAGNIYTNIKPNALYDDAVRLANERDNRHAYLSIGCFNGHIVTFTPNADKNTSILNVGGSRGNTYQNGSWLNVLSYTRGSKTKYYTIGAYK